MTVLSIDNDLYPSMGFKLSEARIYGLWQDLTQKISLFEFIFAECTIHYFLPGYAFVLTKPLPPYCVPVIFARY